MTAAPPVSVILPVRNEVGSLEATLEAILAQDYPGDLDVHVVDGGSDDGTIALLERFAEREPNFRWSSNPQGRTARSLNQGIASTSGEIVVRCDGRSLLPSHYVSTAVRLITETGAANVGGIQRAVGRGWVQKAVALATNSVFGAGDSRFRTGGEPGPVDTVYLGVFPRRVLEEVGGFDENFVRNQDAELNSRIRKSGRIVYFTPELSAEYEPRGSLGSLGSQYFEYGQWRRETTRAHPEHLAWRQLIPPLFVLGLVASLVLGVFGQARAALVVPVVYGAFLLLAVISLAGRGGAAALLTPIVLPVIHVSWGVGFLVGPIK